MLLHEDEITSRPARTWFQSTEQKQKTKQMSKEIADQEKLNAGAKRIKVVDEDDFRDEETDAVMP